MAALGPFAADRRVVVAVSGGSDSMALAWLLAGWGAPVAAIVDHGLRPEAAAEAQITAAQLARFGVASYVYTVALAPGPAAAERAREARYRLLLQACRHAGCADLILGHHASDQAETVRMRQDAGSAAAGLAGMAAIAYRDDARLLRPLLSLDKARLRATLRRAGIGWVEDPTNHDRRTLRARLRNDADPASTAAAHDLGRRAALERSALERRVAEELAAVAIHPEGFAIAPGPLGDDALSALIWTISGRRYPPPRAALAAGLAARTVHGVLLRPARALGPGTLIAREPAAVAAPAPAQAGLVWDGRFRIAVAQDGRTVGALGLDAARLRARSHLPSCVLRALPAIRDGTELIAVPHLAFPVAADCPSFVPARPATAGFH